MKRERLDQMRKIAYQLTKRQQSVSVAESCTGGLLGASFTDLPGSSYYFLGGVIAYANHIKCDLLGVNPKTLSAFGAVSEEVASEMALGILSLTGSDWGLATTGIAGPDGGTADKPIGTVWISVADKHKHKASSWKLLISSPRSVVREETVFAILDQLLGRLSD